MTLVHHYQTEPLPTTDHRGHPITYFDRENHALSATDCAYDIHVGDNLYDTGLDVNTCERCEDVMLHKHYRINPETSQIMNYEDVTGSPHPRGRMMNVVDWSFDDDGYFRPTREWLEYNSWGHSPESWYGEYLDGGTSWDYVCSSCRDVLDEEEENARESHEEYNPEKVLSYSTKYGDDYDLNFIDVGSVTSEAKPADQFGITETERQPVRVAKPYVGIELEMTPGRDSACRKSEAAELLSDYDPNYPHDVFMLKEDGSVSSGFELVTQPHTLKAMREAKFWQGVETLRQRGWRAWDCESVGLHVHINSASFINVAHAMRFVMFIYGNAKPLTRFAGRTSSYAKFDMASFASEVVRYDTDDNGDLTPRIERSLPAVLRKQVQHGDRYLAVNAGSLYSKTLELRFFRGCMLPWVNHAHIEFTFALHEYTMGLNSHDCVAKRALSWASFLTWLKARSRDADFDYPNLLRRLSDSRRNHYSEYITNTDGDGIVIPS